MPLGALRSDSRSGTKKPGCSRTEPLPALASSGSGAIIRSGKKSACSLLQCPPRESGDGVLGGQPQANNVAITRHAPVVLDGGKHPDFRGDATLRGAAEERGSWLVHEVEGFHTFEQFGTDDYGMFEKF
jgi:hypothetical protein